MVEGDEFSLEHQIKTEPKGHEIHISKVKKIVMPENKALSLFH
jgi:hypothetical protein